MTLCNICPNPGECCQGLTLAGGHPDIGFFNEIGLARERAELLIRFFDLPFVPSKIRTNGDGDPIWEFSCTALLPNGACAIYDRRPDVCRSFEPGSDPLCVFGRKLLTSPGSTP